MADPDTLGAATVPGPSLLRRMDARLPIIRLFLGKLLSALLLILGVVTVNFILVHLAPGDPVAVLVGETEPTPEQLQALYARMGLDQPLYIQYLRYLQAIVQGDLGYSYVSQASVASLIFERLPATFGLVFSSLVTFSALGVALALAVAARPYSWFDNLGSVLAVIGHSVPTFWLGQLALVCFAMWLGWFPTNGMTTTRLQLTGVDYVLDLLHHLVLPGVVLGLRYLAINFRFARASMRDALSQDYIVAARAKGLGEGRVLYHAFRNGILPVVTVFALNVSDVLAGAVLTEIVFGWPGLGRLMYDAMYARDYPLLMGMFLFISIGVITVNFLVDILYGVLDPRVRAH